MGVHDDHRRRVYERFLREGLAGFEEHNAMEFLLFLARPRGDTNPLAHALIDRFGSLWTRPSKNWSVCPAWGIPAPSCSNLSRRCAHIIWRTRRPTKCRLQA